MPLKKGPSFAAFFFLSFLSLYQLPQFFLTRAELWIRVGFTIIRIRPSRKDRIRGCRSIPRKTTRIRILSNFNLIKFTYYSFLFNNWYSNTHNITILVNNTLYNFRRILNFDVETGLYYENRIRIWPIYSDPEPCFWQLLLLFSIILFFHRGNWYFIYLAMPPPIPTI